MTKGARFNGEYGDFFVIPKYTVAIAVFIQIVMSYQVLVVEDEANIAATICYALKQASIAAQHVTSAQAALDVLAQQPPDLMVLDVGLPDMDGFELCRQIRQSHALPILFLTARSDEIDRVVGLEIGGDDYICKPFSPRELVARVKAHLRRVVKVALPRQSGLHLNTDTRQACIGEQALVLTRYEFDLLSVFYHSPGVVFSRDQLLDKVWGHDSDSLDRVVDTHIKTLRAKIKPWCETELILTHRGVGYSLRNL